MIKVIVTEEFTLGRFDELKNLERCSSRNQRGRLYEGDTFECTEEMVKYLTGGNEEGATVVKVIEVEPFICKDRGEECVVPLQNSEVLEKIEKEIEKHIKKPRKKR